MFAIIYNEQTWFSVNISSVLWYHSKNIRLMSGNRNRFEGIWQMSRDWSKETRRQCADQLTGGVVVARWCGRLRAHRCPPVCPTWRPRVGTSECVLFSVTLCHECRVYSELAVGYKWLLCVPFGITNSSRCVVIAFSSCIECFPIVPFIDPFLISKPPCSIL